MSAEFASSRADPAALADEWEALAERVGASPFLRPGWCDAWWRAFGRGRLELRIVRRTADGRLAALLPVRRTRAALASPTNWHTPEFGILSEDAGATAALLQALFEGGPRHVALGFLAPAQASALSERATQRGYRVIRRTLQRSPVLALSGTWEDCDGRLLRDVRGDVLRRRRRLEERGAVALEVATAWSPAELEDALTQGFAIEASGWKGAQGTAIGSDARVRGFYAEVARWAAARGWLRLAFLRLDGRALAFDLCLEHADTHWLVKTGYDPAFRAFAPGKNLRREMIARAFRAGLASYEMLGDAESWKLEWTSSTRPRELVQAFAPSLAGNLDHTWFAHGRPFAKRLRDLAREVGRRTRKRERARDSAPEAPVATRARE